MDVRVLKTLHLFVVEGYDTRFQVVWLVLIFSIYHVVRALSFRQDETSLYFYTVCDGERFTDRCLKSRVVVTMLPQHVLELPHEE